MKYLFRTLNTNHHFHQQYQHTNTNYMMMISKFAGFHMRV
jgi:hypothetical protein